MEYLIPAILLCVGIFCYDYLKLQRGRLVLWILICVYLILLAGLRYKLGEDTFHYLSAYERINSLDKIRASDFARSRFNPGFIIVFSFFKMLTPEFVFFQIFQAAVINSVYFYFFYKNCKNIFFAGFLYFLFLYVFTSFLQMRESFAVAIFLLAWPLFLQKKWILWYLASLLAFSFHLSSLIMFFLPIIYLPWVRELFVFGKRTWVILLGILILGYFVQKVFLQYIELFSVLQSVEERAQAYQKDEMGGAVLNYKGIIAQIIKYVVYPMIALYVIHRNKKELRRYGFSTLEAFVLINTYLVIFSLFIDIILRFTNYFFGFVIILLADFIFSTVQIKGRKYRFGFLTWFFFFLPMIAFSIHGLVFTKLNKSGSIKTYMLYYPYNSYLYQQDDHDQNKTYRYIFKPRKKL